MKLSELTALFRKLGAPDPGQWARSQRDEGIDQLARFVFLRQAWKLIVAPDDAGWIDQTLAGEQPGRSEPCSGLGPALTRMLAAGAERDDIHEVVRVMQYELLASLCCMLEDPGELEDEIADLTWQLVRTKADGEVVGPIDGLHESLLELDPSGREMRPPAKRATRTRGTTRATPSAKAGRKQTRTRRRKTRA